MEPGRRTLLRILAGLESADSGTVTCNPPSATVGYLPQEPERRGDETLHAFLARRTGVAVAEAALEADARDLAAGIDGADDAYAIALDRFLSLGGPDFDGRVGAVCAELGIPERLLTLPTGVLSGGEAARASLAAILLARFDVFLLDEPTNDLDFEGLSRLEEFVATLPGAAVIVSHDRTFLDRTITSVLELDAHDHTAREFSGGWSAYLEERAIARRHAEEAYAEYTAKRSALADRAQQQREWSLQGVSKVRKSGENDKHIRHFRNQASEHVAAKAKITERAAERLEVVEKPWEGWELRMEIATAPRSGSVVARLERAVVARGDFVLGPIDLEIGWAERVAILGPNGSGKSTLLLALLGELPLASGERRMGPSVKVGTLEQARAAFSAASRYSTRSAPRAACGESESVVAREVRPRRGARRPCARDAVAGRTHARELALFSATGVNCLVLDEPTNHLDLPAIEQLEQALEGYEGTLLVVTHDRELLEALRFTRTVEVAAGQVVADRAV